jgi:phenylalanyl-tRNA synthetase beta chain
MTGELPKNISPKEFIFETKLKNALSGWGGIEVYTLSLVPKEYTNGVALALKNPLGTDSEYLRTSLMPSLISAAKQNLGTFEKFHLFEMANVYLPRKNDLPKEQLMLGGVFEGYDYREAKGIIEALLEKLHINFKYEVQENKSYAAGKSTIITSKNKEVGKFGYIENSELIYYEFEVSKLFELSTGFESYKEISKYPAQIEDITIQFPTKTLIGEVMEIISSTNKLIEKVELKDIFKDAYTFRIWYQDPEKTLTDVEVEKIRKEILSSIKTKFGGIIKE